MSHRAFYRVPTRMTPEGAQPLTGTAGSDKSEQALLAPGHPALLFSLSDSSSGPQNPVELLFHMDKQAIQLGDSNHKGQKSKWQA